MTDHPSLFTRVIVGKITGFAIGLAGFVLLPYFIADVGWQLRWGVLLWYTTLGAVIGVFGVFARHPVLNFPLPWWFRAPLVGGWMNFVLTFFAWNEMKAALTAMFGAGSILEAPFWFVLEGAVVGLIIGYAATRVGGEGPETAAG